MSAYAVLIDYPIAAAILAVVSLVVAFILTIGLHRI